MANILLIDDEPLVVETLSNAITSKGHTVVTAANGVEGMKQFTQGKYDLVITDIIMPDKEGIELIMEMKRHTPASRLLLFLGADAQGM